MAGAEMTRTNFTQLRLRLSALVAGDRATAGKVAALRRVDRARHVAGKNLAVLLRFCTRVRNRHCGKQSLGIRMQRVRIQIVGRSELNDIAEVHNGETVEGTMRYFAREFDPENEEFWGIVGLLHDLDWEEHEDDPMNHTIYAAEILEGEGASPELIRAIQTHTSDFNTSLPKPELQMEKILFACDELTGLIGAAVIMRPSKSVMDFTTKSLKKKFKDKRFAAGCSRDVISQGAEMLGWELPELFDRTIAAMQSFAPDRDTFQA